uniref:Chlororespiratory reduction 3 n=1 Tax=Monsonia marlothii TaxID=163685 RepID=A0A0F7H156_9ROSI
MSCCLSTSRALVLASLPDNSQPQQTKTPKLSLPRRSKNVAIPGKKKQSFKKGSANRPSVYQIERAIGAGRFRDINREEEGKKTEFDGVLPITTGQFETPIEESLRKTGRWLADKTPTSGSAGKGVVVFLFQWFLPLWTVLLLVGAGIIKLPFNTPFLDDLLM